MIDVRRILLAAMIDHSVLSPETTVRTATKAVYDGQELGVASVCLPSWLVTSVPHLVPICSVVGFPSGAVEAEVKMHEAERAIADGASEIDMVINLGAAHSGRFRLVDFEIRQVRSVCMGKVLKVVLESATFDYSELKRVAIIARDAGADYLKTSTGYHPAGGATVAAVKVLASVASDCNRPVEVKASGGIRTYEDAVAMISAGATRIGTSYTKAILDGVTA